MKCFSLLLWFGAFAVVLLYLDGMRMNDIYFLARVYPSDAYSSFVEWKEHRCSSSGKLGLKFQLCCFLPDILGNMPHRRAAQSDL